MSASLFLLGETSIVDSDVAFWLAAAFDFADAIAIARCCSGVIRIVPFALASCDPKQFDLYPLVFHRCPSPKGDQNQDTSP